MPEIQNSQQPWFRNPMVWLVIFFPMSAVVGGIITIIIAVKTDDGLVVDDYYKQGLAINQVLELDRGAKQLGISALLDINSETGQIELSLKSQQALTPSGELGFRLVHRTRSGKDQTTSLSRIGNSDDYRGFIKPPIIEGRWNVIVEEPGVWRIRQDFTTKQATHILLNING